MDTKKILEFNLNMSKPINRLVRRAIMIGLLTGVAILLTGVGEMHPVYLPVITGMLALIDKGIREYKNEQDNFNDNSDDVINCNHR